MLVTQVKSDQVAESDASSSFVQPLASSKRLGTGKHSLCSGAVIAEVAGHVLTCWWLPDGSMYVFILDSDLGMCLFVGGCLIEVCMFSF